MAARPTTTRRSRAPRTGASAAVVGRASVHGQTLSPTYLSRAALTRAPMLTAAELSKARSRDISGPQWEELWCDIVGGGAMLAPRRRNRPVPDAYGPRPEQLAYSLKTVAPDPAECRPTPSDWLGAELAWIMTRLQPPALPGSRTHLDASPRVLGRALAAAWNDLIERNGWDQIAYLVRLRFDGYRAYLYWEEPAEAVMLDPAALRWSDSPHAVEAEVRNIHAHHRSERGRRRGGRGGLAGADRGHDAAAVRWTSGGGQFYMRRRIPEDADVWVLPDELVLSRTEATAAIMGAIHERLMAA